MSENPKVVQRDDGWWITDMPEGCDECGPYITRKEALEERAGLIRTFENWDKRRFWTLERVS